VPVVQGLAQRSIQKWATASSSEQGARWPPICEHPPQALHFLTSHSPHLQGILPLLPFLLIPLNLRNPPADLIPCSCLILLLLPQGLLTATDGGGGFCNLQFALPLFFTHPGSSAVFPWRNAKPTLHLLVSSGGLPPSAPNFGSASTFSFSDPAAPPPRPLTTLPPRHARWPSWPGLDNPRTSPSRAPLYQSQDLCASPSTPGAPRCPAAQGVRWVQEQAFAARGVQGPAPSATGTQRLSRRLLLSRASPGI